MDVLILAAGFGTRLYPLTEKIPKALIKIQEKPVLEYILDKLIELPDIEKIYVLVNNKFYINFLEWFNQFQITNKGVKIVILNNGINADWAKKGAVTDLKYALGIIQPKEDLFILACDSLFEFNLKDMIKMRKILGSSTVALKKMENKELTKKYSSVIIDFYSHIIDFEEKPQNPKSCLCATACYLLTNDDLNLIVRTDFEKTDNLGNIIEFLINKSKVYGTLYEDFWLDIGSLEELNLARRMLEEKK